MIKQKTSKLTELDKPALNINTIYMPNIFWEKGAKILRFLCA
jgi:hypothetical protein